MGSDEAWTAPVPVLGMTFLTRGPEETTRAQEGPGALMMRTAAGEEEEEEEGGEEVEGGLIILPPTASTSLDTNQVHGGMNTTP